MDPRGERNKSALDQGAEVDQMSGSVLGSGAGRALLLQKPVQQETLLLYKPGLAGGAVDVPQGRGTPRQGLVCQCF